MQSAWKCSEKACAWTTGTVWTAGTLPLAPGYCQAGSERAAELLIAGNSANSEGTCNVQAHSDSVHAITFKVAIGKCCGHNPSLKRFGCLHTPLSTELGTG